MRLLPILWAEEPSTRDWERLTAAKEETGYMEKIRPARAYQGSPAPILCIGKRPDWVVPHAYVESVDDHERLVDALEYVLGMSTKAEVTVADQLSLWFNAPVRQIGDEAYEPMG